ncbi:MAG: toxin secretion, membrane fusion protein [Candidatus Methylacidiphilales bacterium]
MFNQEINKSSIKIIKRGSEEDDDTLFWLSKTPLERLIALEEIRKSYNDWKYGTEQRFQRVYRIIKRQQS